MWNSPNRLDESFVVPDGAKRWDYLILACKYLEINPRRIVEIGVNKGRCIEAMARKMPDVEEFFAIDPYVADMRYLEHGHAPGHMCRHPDQDYFDMCYERAKKLLSRHEKIKLLRMTSLEASQEIKGNVDVVFIDGDHSFEGTKLDITTWMMKLSPHGLIAGHDFDYIDHVRDAVIHFFGDGNFHRLCGPGDCWGYSS